MYPLKTLLSNSALGEYGTMASALTLALTLTLLEGSNDQNKQKNKEKLYERFLLKNAYFRMKCTKVNVDCETVCGPQNSSCRNLFSRVLTTNCFSRRFFARLDISFLSSYSWIQKILGLLLRKYILYIVIASSC